MKIVAIKDVVCPFCEQFYNVASQPNPKMEPKRQPRPGEPGLCLHCGEIVVFNENLALAKPTPKQLTLMQFLSWWPLIVKARERIRAKRAIEKN